MVLYSCVTRCENYGLRLFNLRGKLFKTLSNMSDYSTNSSSNQLKVFVTQSIPDEALNILKENNLNVIINENIPLTRDALLKSVQNIDALYCTLNEKVDKQLLDTAGEQLKVIATCSVGYDHIDIKECHSRKIPVGYTPGVLTDATAEFALALLLASSRRIPEGINAAKNGEWSTWKIMWMNGRSLKGSTIGIFGLGRIGQAIAKRLSGFEVNKILYNSRNKVEEAHELLKCEYVSFDELLNKSDFLICCCAATQQTFQIFNKNTFKKMKSNSIFINVSRGSVVNQDDLYEALENKTIEAAALDVTTPEPLPLDHPLLKLSNCLITPHICSSEKSTRVNMATITSQNIVRGLKKLQLLYEIQKQ